jgi:hypothetical protein
MIIGNGSLAKLLKDREGAILFASGVGNSLCDDNDLYDKERNDIRRAYFLMGEKSKVCFFYFSTISVFTQNTRYTKHKEEMERYVDFYFHNYNIIRLGNIWECTNPHTFRNAIKTKQARATMIPSEPVEIRDEWKYMIHADQLNMVVQGMPLTGKNEISIFDQMLKVKDCL